MIQSKTLSIPTVTSVNNLRPYCRHSDTSTLPSAVHTHYTSGVTTRVVPGVHGHGWLFARVVANYQGGRTRGSFGCHGATSPPTRTLFLLFLTGFLLIFFTYERGSFRCQQLLLPSLIFFTLTPTISIITMTTIRM